MMDAVTPTEPAIAAPEFFVISTRHTLRCHKYITVWRAESAGYAFPLHWAGRYSAEDVERNPSYFNNGFDTIAVPCNVLEAMAVDPDDGDIDNNAGPVVLNRRANWKRILAAVRDVPLESIPTNYPGAARVKRKPTAK